jgi:hypothetical protein
MARKPDAADALTHARSTLASLEAQIGELTSRRRGRLLAGDDATAIAALDTALDKLQHAARTERDRIVLLEAEAEREAGERRARERAGLIDRIERRLAARDAAGAKMAAAIVEMEKAFREYVRLGREIAAAWPWPSHDLPTAMVTPGSIQIALSHELYRVGSRPQLYGGQDTVDAGLHLPGAKSPTFQLVGQPDKVTPLTTVLAEASRYASELMRAGTVATPSASAPETTGTRSSAQVRLSALLARQAELAEDQTPEGEKAYQELIAELAVVSAEVE